MANWLKTYRTWAYRLTSANTETILLELVLSRLIPNDNWIRMPAALVANGNTRWMIYWRALADKCGYQVYWKDWLMDKVYDETSDKWQCIPYIRVRCLLGWFGCWFGTYITYCETNAHSPIIVVLYLFVYLFSFHYIIPDSQNTLTSIDGDPGVGTLNGTFSS